MKTRLRAGNLKRDNSPLVSHSDGVCKPLLYARHFSVSYAHASNESPLTPFSCGSCIELAILRLQTFVKHRRPHSRWAMSFFDSEGVHEAEALNVHTIGQSWSSLTLASANSLRKELERVAKALSSPCKAPEQTTRITAQSWKSLSSDASLATSKHSDGRLTRIQKALRSAQGAWDQGRDASRVQQSVVLFTARLSESDSHFPGLDAV